jgi:superoxide dismutase
MRVAFDRGQQRAAIEPIKDAESPLLFGRIALLGLHVWEPAYLYQNARLRYVEVCLSHLENWRFANENHETCVLKDGA